MNSRQRIWLVSLGITATTAASFLTLLNSASLFANAKANTAFSLAQSGNCKEALTVLESTPQTLIERHTNAVSLTIIDHCYPQLSAEQKDLTLKAVELARRQTELQPTSVKNWILTFHYIALLLQYTTDPLERQTLAREAEEAIAHTKEMAPGHAESISMDEIRVKLWSRKTEEAITLIEQRYPKGQLRTQEHWLLLTIAYIHQDKFEKAKEALYQTKKKWMESHTVTRIDQIPLVEPELLLLASAYREGLQKDDGNADIRYRRLAELYQQLLRWQPNNPQYHAFLATAYRETGEYDLAKAEALKILELSPESREQIEEFLNTLPR